MSQADLPMARSGGAGESADRLVVGLRQKESWAHTELIKHFGPRLHRYIARHLQGNDDLAEGIMVMTLVEGVQNVQRFSPTKGTLSAWLYGIARRLIGQELRQQCRRKSPPASAQVSIEMVSEQGASGDMAITVTARLQAQRQVAQLASYLSQVEMEVLMLHYVDQLSVKEIARALGRTGKSVDSLLHRAKQKARERLVVDEG